MPVMVDGGEDCLGPRAGAQVPCFILIQLSWSDKREYGATSNDAREYLSYAWSVKR